MDVIIEFFRDTLDGPFYIAWVVVLVILIFACIGYLAEKGINNKKEKEKYATVDDSSINSAVTGIESVEASSIGEPTFDTTVSSNNVSVTNSEVVNPVLESNGQGVNTVQEVPTSLDNEAIAGGEPLGENNAAIYNTSAVNSDVVGTIPTIVSDGLENSEQAVTSVQEVSAPSSTDVSTDNSMNEQVTPAIPDIAEPSADTTVNSDNVSTTNETNSNIEEPVSDLKGNVENNEQTFNEVQEITAPLNNENVVIPAINQDESTTV